MYLYIHFIIPFKDFMVNIWSKLPKVIHIFDYGPP